MQRSEKFLNAVATIANEWNNASSDTMNTKVFSAVVEPTADNGLAESCKMMMWAEATKEENGLYRIHEYFLPAQPFADEGKLAASLVEAYPDASAPASYTSRQVMNKMDEIVRKFELAGAKPTECQPFDRTSYIIKGFEADCKPL